MGFVTVCDRGEGRGLKLSVRTHAFKFRHMKFPVFVLLNLNKSILPPSLQTFQQIHYDAYCTTVKLVIEKRVCKNAVFIMHR